MTEDSNIRIAQAQFVIISQLFHLGKLGSFDYILPEMDCILKK